MATIFHLGGYGSGKTYGALLLGIYSELTRGSRGIVTNLALLNEPKIKGKTISGKSGLGALNELLHHRFKNLDTRVLQRVRLLDESEVPHFFCHRISRGGLHYDIPVPDDDAEKRGARPDFSLLRDDGIVFVIDEFHDYFNARLWAEVGRSVGWYKNQQRKLGDDIHACTPQIDEVDKQLRTIGHEYRVYHNLGLRKVRGVVLPQTFICTVYSSLDSVKRGGQPLNKYPFTLDVELANCYDTAKGVRGLQGGSADIGKRPRGIHWLVPVLFFLAVIAGILWLSFYARRHLMQKLAPHNVVAAVPNPSPRPVPVVTVPPPVAAAALPSLTNPPAPPVFCVGWCKVGDHYLAFLSDGAVYDSADHELDWIQKRKISILGKVYDIKPAALPPSVPAPPQPLPVYGNLTPPKPVNQIEVIPFGNRHQPTPLPDDANDPQAENGRPRFGFTR